MANLLGIVAHEVLYYKINSRLASRLTDYYLHTFPQDYEGQRLAERLSLIIIILFAVSMKLTSSVFSPFNTLPFQYTGGRFCVGLHLSATHPDSGDLGSWSAYECSGGLYYFNCDSRIINVQLL